MANSVVLEMLVTQITFAINKFLTRVKFHGSSKGMFNPDKKKTKVVYQDCEPSLDSNGY